MRRSNPWIVLLTLVWVAVALGCQGLSGPGAGSASAVDPLQRILADGKLRVGMSGVQPPLNMKDVRGEGEITPARSQSLI